MDTQLASGEAAPAPDHAPKRQNDLALNIVVGVLLVAVLGLGGYFGYSVWLQRQQSRLANPSLRAVELWQKQVKSYPNDASVRVRLGEALASAGQLDDAITQFKAALKIDPKHPGAYMDLAQVASQKKDYASAEGYLQKILELTNDEYADKNPRREEAYFHLGEVTLMEKHYDDAVGYLKAALRIKSSSADSYFRLAQAYEGLGADDNALKQLELAFQFDPKYAEAHYEAGNIFLRKKDNLNAAIQFRLAVTYAPDASEPKQELAKLGTAEDWLVKAQASLKSGKADDAIRDCNMARALDPKDLAAAKLEAQLLEKRGDKKGALQAYKDALALAPSDAEVKAAVARLSSPSPKK